MNSTMFIINDSGQNTVLQDQSKMGTQPRKYDMRQRKLDPKDLRTFSRPLPKNLVNDLLYVFID